MIRRRLGLLLVAAGCVTAARPMQPRPQTQALVLAAADKARRRGELGEAESAYRHIVALDNGSVRAHAGLQEVQRRQGLSLDLRRAYARGRPYLRGRLELDDAARAAHYRNAVEPYRSMGLGRWERSRTMDPGHSWIRVALGRRFLVEGRLGQAESEFLAALWAEPGHPAAAYGMSLVLDRRGDHAGALRWAVRAFEASPGHDAFANRLHGVGRRAGDGKSRARAAGALGKGGQHALLLAGQLGGPEADGYFERARRRGASAVEVDARRTMAPPKAVRTFVERFGDAVRAKYRHYASTGESEDFDAFVSWARALFTETTGVPLAKAGRIQDFAFVGKLVDPSAASDEPLVRECARHGLLLVLGQRSNGPPEALLARIVSREKRGPVQIRGMTVQREAVHIRSRYVSGFQEWAGRGEVAGLALVGFLVIDDDSIARWEGDIRRTRKRLLPYRERILAQDALKSDDPLSIDDPAGIGDRMRLTAPLNVGDEVRVHEEAHLVDAVRHLPVGDHFFRNLSLAVRSGFSSRNVLAYLERNAQLTAIAEGRSPRAALATCCAALGGSGPHAQGYGEIVLAMVRAIARSAERYPEIDTKRVIVQQLHRLPKKKVRALARHLMERWGVNSAG